MAIVLPEGKGDPIREEFLLGPMDLLCGLVVIAPARRAGDPGSNPSPGENFFSIVCTLRNYNLNSREKFEPGPGFELRTFRSLAWRSTI